MKNKTSNRITQVNHHYSSVDYKNNKKVEEDNNKIEKFIKVEKMKIKRNEKLQEIKNKSVEPISKIERESNFTKYQEIKIQDRDVKKEMFKAVKNYEHDIKLKRKAKEVMKKEEIRSIYEERLKTMNEGISKEQMKLKDFENEEIEILKRMNKSTVLLNSSKFFI